MARPRGGDNEPIATEADDAVFYRKDSFDKIPR
jgi:hypothetical protein